MQLRFIQINLSRPKLLVIWSWALGQKDETLIGFQRTSLLIYSQLIAQHECSVQIAWRRAKRWQDGGLSPWAALPLTDEVRGWNSSHCGILGRELLFVSLELVSKPLVWDAGIQ